MRPEWSQSLTATNSMFTHLNCSLLPGLPIFSKRFPNRQSHAGASWLINSIERPYPFCSIPIQTNSGFAKMESTTDFEHEQEHEQERGEAYFTTSTLSCTDSASYRCVDENIEQTRFGPQSHTHKRFRPLPVGFRSAFDNLPKGAFGTTAATVPIAPFWLR
jgi:hypothetical protein